ncbi:MAG: IS3 family transposase [Kiritimatiellae bacterium]|nr:IS3 family transposase [Kiritimatiellia bacterium]
MKTHLNEFSIKALSRAMQIQRSGFYAHQKASAQAHENARLLEEIQRVYCEHQGRYGSTRVTLQLQKEGFSCSENRVARLMRIEGLAGICPRRKPPTYNR